MQPAWCTIFLFLQFFLPFVLVLAFSRSCQKAQFLSLFDHGLKHISWRKLPSRNTSDLARGPPRSLVRSHSEVFIQHGIHANICCTSTGAFHIWIRMMKSGFSFWVGVPAAYLVHYLSPLGLKRNEFMQRSTFWRRRMRECLNTTLVSCHFLLFTFASDVWFVALQSRLCESSSHKRLALSSCSRFISSQRG